MDDLGLLQSRVRIRVKVGPKIREKISIDDAMKGYTVHGFTLLEGNELTYLVERTGEVNYLHFEQPIKYFIKTSYRHIQQDTSGRPPKLTVEKLFETTVPCILAK